MLLVLWWHSGLRHSLCVSGFEPLASDTLLRPGPQKHKLSSRYMECALYISMDAECNENIFFISQGIVSDDYAEMVSTLSIVNGEDYELW